MEQVLEDTINEYSSFDDDSKEMNVDKIISESFNGKYSNGSNFMDEKLECSSSEACEILENILESNCGSPTIVIEKTIKTYGYSFRIFGYMIYFNIKIVPNLNDVSSLYKPMSYFKQIKERKWQ